MCRNECYSKVQIYKFYLYQEYTSTAFRFDLSGAGGGVAGLRHDSIQISIRTGTWFETLGTFCRVVSTLRTVSCSFDRGLASWVSLLSLVPDSIHGEYQYRCVCWFCMIDRDILAHVWVRRRAVSFSGLPTVLFSRFTVCSVVVVLHLL